MLTKSTVQLKASCVAMVPARAANSVHPSGAQMPCAAQQFTLGVQVPAAVQKSPLQPPGCQRTSAPQPHCHHPAPPCSHQ